MTLAQLLYEVEERCCEQVLSATCCSRRSYRTRSRRWTKPKSPPSEPSSSRCVDSQHQVPWALPGIVKGGLLSSTVEEGALPLLVLGLDDELDSTLLKDALDASILRSGSLGTRHCFGGG